MQIQQFFLHQFQAFFRRIVVFFFQRRFFNFQLDDAAVELVHAFGHGFAFHFDQRRCFVYQINRFVGQETVGDVTCRQFGRCDNGRVGNVHFVVDFITLFQAAQNRNRGFHARLVHHHFLETALKSRVFFNVLAVFV